MDKPRRVGGACFQPGGHRPKHLLRYALLLACTFVLSAVEVRADGFSITFDDSSDTPTVTVTGSNIDVAFISTSCVGETCTVSEYSPWYLRLPIFGADFNIGDAGTTPLVSDSATFQLVDNSHTYSGYNVLTLSLNSGDPTSAPQTCELYGCSFFEGGDPITSSVNWWSTTNDQILYLSDSDVTTVPEPSTILPLLAGFAGLGITKLRGKVAARRKWLG